ncbi:hypothetical protein [Christiangramia salexigens]|nr:hypothetical protein [Christiangramia salexigens]
MWFEFRLKGSYTTSIIGMTFWCGTILLYGLTKNKTKRIITGLLTIPTFIIGIMSLIVQPLVLLFAVPYLAFQSPMAKFDIDKKHNIEVRNPGFMACGESLYVTKSEYLIFDKQIYVGNNHCVKGIHKIKTIEFNKQKMIFLIYHDGVEKEENPYKYEVSRETVGNNGSSPISGTVRNK